MTPDEIERLARAARRAGITTLEWSDGDVTLRLCCDASGAPLATDGARPHRAAAASHRLLSPAVGLFRSRHPATGRAFAETGARVEAGQIVGFVQAGIILHPVTADRPGTLCTPLYEDGAPVGYGVPLYRLT